MAYELCIFDLDGTLTDPKVGITKSFQHALSVFEIQENANSLEKLIGPPLRDSFKNYYGFSETDTEKAVIKFREYFTETGLFENTVYPGIEKTLQELISHEKILAVATSKVTVYANKILEHFNLNKYFSFVFGDEMDGRRTKNGKRDIIKSVIKTLDPESKMTSVMIGDRKHDIIGAKENEIDSIGVTWGYGSRDELELEKTTWIVDSTVALCDLILNKQ